MVRFAQKANSNTHILRLMKEHGVVVDSVSLGEIERALAAGFTPGLRADGHADIVFTADILDRTTLSRVAELGVPVNCGSIDMLEQLGSCQPRPPGVAAHQPRFRARPFQQDQHGRRTQQARHLAR